jgi:hypothetical protein
MELLDFAIKEHNRTSFNHEGYEEKIKEDLPRIK